jgi:hypothetical protein
MNWRHFLELPQNELVSGIVNRSLTRMPFMVVLRDCGCGLERK